MSGEQHDFDWLVIGSGFGGSVSALRLAEKGYRVAVLEAGRRYEDEDFAETTWNARRYYWLPRLGLRGIFRMTLFKDVFVVSGCGVGGGSLGYANTLYRPRPARPSTATRSGASSRTGRPRSGPTTTPRSGCSGVTTYEGEGPADRLLRDLATEMGVPETYSTTRVGVFFGEPGETVADPYFGGEGPAARGLHPLRRLHGRLPPQREEHAGQELPLVRRAQGRARSCRSAPSSRSARSARPTAPTATP